MKKDDNRYRRDTKGAAPGRQKKPYQSPEVLSVELLEIVATVCGDNGGGKNGPQDCGPFGPYSS